jgi:hypothetical protein
MNSPNELFQKPLAMTFAFVVCTFITDSLVGNLV